MSQNKRPVRPGGMPPRSGAPAGRPVARPTVVQARPGSGPARPAAARPVVNNVRTGAPQRPAATNVRAAAPQRPMAGGARVATSAARIGGQPPRPVRAGMRMPHDIAMLVGIGILVIALGVVGQIVWPNGFSIHGGGAVEAASAVSEIHGSGPIRINELMSSNDSTAVDDNGLTSDWIEVMNISGNPVNLSGYTLAKDQRATNVFEFPDHTLQPGECAVVYADSTLKQNAGAIYHAPFKLSSQGGTLMLFNASGTAIDSVNFPAMTADMSYARQEQSVWNISSMATPGMNNTEESYAALHQARSDVGVEVTEIVSSNIVTLADENGEYYDYFEVHNMTGSAIDMSGWFVSDTVGRATKWRMPEGFVLQAGEYRVVFCSGLNRADAEHPHTNFGLSSEGEAVVLADAEGRVVDTVEFDLLKEDTAWTKAADGSWNSGVPTPGAANG